MEVNIMIEGQNGLNWPRWKRIASAVEDLGFDGLFRSDHYTNARPPDLDSLEIWISLAWLTSHTQRLQFGSLVSPFSFRNPTMLARMARDVDDLSGGRLILGVGAGWQDREHHNYGWDLLDVPRRFKRFEEGLEVLTRLFQSSAPVDFSGEFYRLNEAVLLPRPSRPGGPPVLVGGNGLRRTLPLAARYAVEWNGIYLTPEKLTERNRRLDELLEEVGRSTSAVRRSVMTGVVFGSDAAAVQQKLDSRGRTRQELQDLGIIVGTAPEVVEQIGALQAAGAHAVMLQWLDLDDLDGLEALATGVLPQIKG